MTATGGDMTFADASGQTKADASLDSFVGETIIIKSYTSEARTIKDKESILAYIEIVPKQVKVEGQMIDAKTLYTWSKVVVEQLGKIEPTLKSGKTVSAKVSQTKTAQGRYLSLS